MPAINFPHAYSVYILAAIACEKALKKWRRAWTMALIEQANPKRNDLRRNSNC